MPPVLPVLIPIDDLHEFRARADEAHLADQDVEELREFVNAGAAKPGSDASDARIIADLVRHRAVLRLHHLQATRRFVPHGSELKDGEDLPAPTHSLLSVERRTRRIDS